VLDLPTAHDADAWAHALDVLLPAIHEVDRNATRIWFHFFPVSLARALATADPQGDAVRSLRLEGRYRLAEQADTSHWFLYGHRHWPAVKAAIIERELAHASLLDVGPRETPGPPWTADLAATIRDVAQQAASAINVEEPLLLGISAVGLMTFQQVGLPVFRQSCDTFQAASQAVTRTPAQILAARQRDDSQGLFGFFRGPRTRYSATFDERRSDARFRVINQQHLTTAAASDTRAYSSNRGVPYAGPIPAQCRSGSCGTCWVGILGGAEKLSDVEPLEARRLKECGYLDAAEGTPIIRLACMARASGNVTIAIPPWNGFLGQA
jgi:ferredoxin